MTSFWTYDKRKGSELDCAEFELDAEKAIVEDINDSDFIVENSAYTEK